MTFVTSKNSTAQPIVGNATQQLEQNSKDEEEKVNQKEYVESLEREVNLKRILEQNLRDLQSQYYEAVKELDDYKGESESKISELDQSICNLNGKLEISQNELSDAREQSTELQKQLNDIKDSSQTLEKKYHRAKRIIKDMQSREQSFNRREQLYQQKLDEIEFELGVLINSVDKTIYDDGIKFFSLIDSISNSQQRQHQAQLDAFGLIRQMLNNFRANPSTQNPQIKQRVVSILEQQLANLMVLANGNQAVTGCVPIVAAHSIGRQSLSSDIISQQLTTMDNKSKLSQNSTANSQSASHRLSQPNLPHPVGVSGQPTKLFRNLNPLPISVSTNEPSPPQSVNSYPSTNSLNSLNNNNNTSSMNNNNNNIMMAAKLREQPMVNDLQLNTMSSVVSSSATVSNEEKFQPVPDIQVPYQTNEWHDKPGKIIQPLDFLPHSISPSLIL